MKGPPTPTNAGGTPADGVTENVHGGRRHSIACIANVNSNSARDNSVSGWLVTEKSRGSSRRV
jgi:hypothetical protein